MAYEVIDHYGKDDQYESEPEYHYKPDHYEPEPEHHYEPEPETHYEPKLEYKSHDADDYYELEPEKGHYDDDDYYYYYGGKSGKGSKGGHYEPELEYHYEPEPQSDGSWWSSGSSSHGYYNSKGSKRQRNLRLTPSVINAIQL